MSENEVEMPMCSLDYEKQVDNLVNSDGDEDDGSYSIHSKPPVENHSQVSQLEFGSPSSDYGAHESYNNMDACSLNYGYGTSSLQEHEGSNFDDSDASSGRFGQSDNSNGYYNSDYYYHPSNFSRLGSGSDAVYSDNLGEDFGLEKKMQPWVDNTKEIASFTIELHTYEGYSKVSDFLMKQSEEVTSQSLKIK